MVGSLARDPASRVLAAGSSGLQADPGSDLPTVQQTPVCAHRPDKPCLLRPTPGGSRCTPDLRQVPREERGAEGTLREGAPERLLPCQVLGEASSSNPRWAACPAPCPFAPTSGPLGGTCRPLGRWGKQVAARPLQHSVPSPRLTSTAQSRKALVPSTGSARSTVQPTA